MSARRILIAVALCAALAAAMAIVAAVDTDSPMLREVVVQVPGLNREVTMLEAADLQGDRFGAGQADIERLLSGRRVDAVVLGGDILDFEGQPRRPVYEFVDVMRRHAPHVYYLRGNHDPLDLGADLAARGVEPMRDGEVLPLAAEPTSAVALVYATRSSAVEAAGGGRALTVFVSHTPPDPGRIASARSLGRGTHLFVAGHTHGGQVRLPLLGAIAAPMSWYAEQGGLERGDNEVTLFPDLKGRLVSGMYERDGQRVFVTRGVGTTGFGIRGMHLDVRFLDRAELVLFRFVPAKR